MIININQSQPIKDYSPVENKIFKEQILSRDNKLKELLFYILLFWFNFSWLIPIGYLSFATIRSGVTSGEWILNDLAPIEDQIDWMKKNGFSVKIEVLKLNTALLICKNKIYGRV
jgi:hypothetical protein